LGSSWSKTALRAPSRTAAQSQGCYDCQNKNTRKCEFHEIPLKAEPLDRINPNSSPCRIYGENVNLLSILPLIDKSGDLISLKLPEFVDIFG
jgi:hypothetical protein